VDRATAVVDVVVLRRVVELEVLGRTVVLVGFLGALVTVVDSQVSGGEELGVEVVRPSEDKDGNEQPPKTAATTRATRTTASARLITDRGACSIRRL
jgi:hypothetical protein